jgi:hypothetical protein
MYFIENVAPASITSNATSQGNFWINNTWTNPVDADFSYVYFAYANGTSLEQNVSTPTNYLYLTWPAGYTQNISAQTVDTNGNMNTTLVWFNATTLNVWPVSVYNNAWQSLMVNNTMTYSQYCIMVGCTYLSGFNVTSQAFESYKAGWLQRTSQNLTKGSGVLVKVSSNHSFDMAMNESYNWNLNVGWNLVGIERNATLAQINSSVNTGCTVAEMGYTDPATRTEYTFTCGSSGNAGVQVLAGQAVMMNSSSAISKARSW